YYPGLINSSSNLCFLNAVLQSLASMPNLIEYLTLINSHTPFNSTGRSQAVTTQSVSTTLLDTLAALNIPSSDHRLVLRPLAIVQALVYHHQSESLFNSEQQDAQEFLVTMIDAIESETKDLLEDLRMTYQTSSKTDGNPWLERNRFLSLSRSIRRSPFRGLMAHRIACGSCHFSSTIRHSNADHFSLNVPPKLSCRLEECLEEYTRLELLDDYVCTKCSFLKTLESLMDQFKDLSMRLQGRNLNNNDGGSALIDQLRDQIEVVKRRIDDNEFEKDLPSEIKLIKTCSLKTTKQTMFARPPDSLTIHISRSTIYTRGIQLKNHCQVKFPDLLDLNKFCTGPRLSGLACSSMSQEDDDDRNENLYRLTSVVVHFGSHSFGHYITFRRVKATKIFKKNLFSQTSTSNKKNQKKLYFQEQEEEEEDDDDDYLLRDGFGFAAEKEDEYRWIRISDENVQSSSKEEALSSNPFLLMYERV
ncbi:hypothetical protein BY996DRAFT_4530996, partial [Phakopsora pachyrhizi]